jgi:sugar phosphate isomerase/epimerase
MYISLNSVTISNRAPWPEFAHLAQRTGYGGVDVSLSRAMDEGVDSTRALLKELKLKPAAASLPVEFRKDEAAFKAGLQKLAPATQFARAIGCPRMITWVMPSSETPKAELRKVYKDRFQAIAEVLRRSQVRLGLEFIGPLSVRQRSPHEFIWRMDEMLAFARECGPNVGLLLDSWHWHHAGATPADILAAGKRGIVHVHLADAPKLPPVEIRDNERLLPGEGVVDWAGFLRALKKIGYEDGLSLEVFGRGLKDMPVEEAARLALKAAQEVMRKAGVA